MPVIDADAHVLRRVRNTGPWPYHCRRAQVGMEASDQKQRPILAADRRDPTRQFWNFKESHETLGAPGVLSSLT